MEEDGIASVEAMPINVNNFEVHFQPKVLEGGKGEEVISRLSSLSEPLGSRLIFAEGVGIADRLKMLTKKESPSPLKQVQPVAAKLPVEPPGTLH